MEYIQSLKSDIAINKEAGFDIDAAFERLLHNHKTNLVDNLVNVKSESEIEGTKTKLNIYHLPKGGNNQIDDISFANALGDRIIDYAIPKEQIEEGFKSKDSSIFVQLKNKAASLFVRQNKYKNQHTGEVGELLLFVVCEQILKLPQALCKMSIKSDSQVHFHGADGVHFKSNGSGKLNIYWGESKFYQKASDAIRECLKDLAPYLTEDESGKAKRNDIFLMGSNLNTNDPGIQTWVKSRLQSPSDPKAGIQYCGVALVGFDSNVYPDGDVDIDKVTSEIIKESEKWKSQASNKIIENNLKSFEIHFFCFPMRSIENLRNYFANAILGKDSASNGT